MDKFNTAGFEIDFDALPDNSKRAIVSRGLQHYLGNEQAAKVSAKAKAHEEEHGEPLGDDEKAALKAEFVAAAIEALSAGTIGTGHGGGFRGNPVETALRALAKAEVVAVLRKNNIKVPKKAEDTIKTANGEFTLAQLIERRIAAHKDRLTKEANAKVREDQKRAKNAEADEL